ncbi:hypothetical protein [Culturomica massiliensis]|jgi:hypothetical protein|uniref:hypothetical protein n=1 Tax=Culturomica massiliensis TaxID=1841857 RepID=UPI0026659A5E|nr:hypothetical protein [Culturomica massiliensis]
MILYKNIQKGKTKSYGLEWLIAILLFFLSMPYFIWPVPELYNLLLLPFLLFLLPQFEIDKKQLVLNLLLFFSYSFIAFRITLNNGGSALGGLFVAVTFLPFLFVKKELWIKIFESYAKLYALLILFPIIEYILIYFVRIPIPHTLIDPSPFNSHECSYEKYYFLTVMQNGMHLFIPRFSGYFDEPGIVGTISMGLLYATKYDLKKKYNIIILIAGILSFSFFFYLATVIYIMLFCPPKAKIAVAVIAVTLIALLWSNGFLETNVISRFEKFFTKGGLSERDTDLFLDMYENTSFAELFFGIIGQRVPHSTSYKYLLAVCGIMPMALLSVFYFIKAYNLLKFSKEFLIYILTYIFIIAQRPFINVTIYIFLFTVSMYALFYSQKKLSNQSCQ